MIIRRVPLYPTTVFPNEVSNLKVWYKADAMGLANSDPVTTWTDSSGNGFALYDQNTSTKRPTFLTGQINSLPAVSFDGSSDELRTGTSGGGGTNVTWGSDTSTIFAVLQDNSPNPTAGVGVIWASADDGGGFALWQLQRYNNTTTARFRGFDTSASSYNITGTVSNGTSGSDWHIISCVRRTSDVQIYIDGVAVTLVSTSGTNQNKSTPLWLGGAFGGGFTILKLAEFYVYTSALSDTDRHSNESYLSTKYGISVASQ